MMFIHLLFLIHYCLSLKSFTIPYEDFIYCYTTKVYLDLKHPFIIDIDLSLHFTWLSDINLSSNTILLEKLYNNASHIMTFNSTIKVNFTTFQTNLYFTSPSSQSIPIELIFIKNKMYGLYDSIGLGYTQNNQSNSLLHKLKQSNIINYLGFGFIPNITNRNKGEIIFGKIPFNYIRNKYTLTIPLITTNTHLWGFELREFKVGEKVMMLNTTNSYAFFNTKHRAIKAPLKVMKFLIIEYFWWFMKNDLCVKSNKEIYCFDYIVETFPNVTFVIGNSQINLTKGELFILDGNKMKLCIEENEEDVWSIGIIVLRKYISYFDVEKKEIKLYSDNAFGWEDKRNEKEIKKVCFVLSFILIMDILKILMWNSEVIY